MSAQRDRRGQRVFDRQHATKIGHALQEKSIYLLDDVFSAVDGRVASHIHRECLMNLLKGTTRILVTHAVELLSSVDRVILMESGTIVKQG